MSPHAPSRPLALACRCGRVRGQALEASAASGSRLFCYCDDCQAFGDFLAQAGASRELMDPYGGTDIFHTAPTRIRITEGADQLRCMRLSAKGLFRWYTDCCKTPVGNMIGGKLPFIGLACAFIDLAADGRSREEALGKPRAYIFSECAVGALPVEMQPRSPAPILLRSARMLFGWWREAKRAGRRRFSTARRGRRGWCPMC